MRRHQRGFQPISSEGVTHVLERVSCVSKTWIWPFLFGLSFIQQKSQYLYIFKTKSIRPAIYEWEFLSPVKHAPNRSLFWGKDRAVTVILWIKNTVYSTCRRRGANIPINLSREGPRRRKCFIYIYIYWHQEMISIKIFVLRYHKTTTPPPVKIERYGVKSFAYNFFSFLWWSKNKCSVKRALVFHLILNTTFF